MLATEERGFGPAEGSDRGPQEPGSRGTHSAMPWRGIAVGVVLSVLIRLRAYWTPITSDEGGYLAIARAWAHGAVLYRDVWVDRPQGLLVIFRFWDWTSGGSTASLRIMAMIFGAALVVAVGATITLLAGRTAGVLATVLVGISASSPAIEGHIANGELLSGPFAVAGLAVACLALRRSDRQWLFVVSGVVAGLALSVKQSGYEGLLAIGMWLVIAVVMRWRTIGQATAAMFRLVVGVLIVIAVLAIHGALTGYSRWWFAFAGYRLDGRSAVQGADWRRFFVTARIARPTLWPLLAICIVGLLLAGLSWWRRRHTVRRPGPTVDLEWTDDTDTKTDTKTGIGAGTSVLIALWALAATIAFLTGGQFHRHYWITLCPSLGGLAAVLITRHLGARPAFAIALVLLVPTYVNTAKILALSNSEFPRIASGDRRPSIDAVLAGWFDQVRRPGDRLYVMCASAGFYADADEDPLFPYLWEDNVQKVPGAIAELRALLRSTSAPLYVAIYENANTCDPTGETAAIIAENYRPVHTMNGIRVVRRVTS